MDTPNEEIKKDAIGATPELSPDEQRILEQHTRTITEALARGANKKKIVQQLAKQGLTESAAVKLADHVLARIEEYRRSPEYRAAMFQQSRKRIMVGTCWAVGGVIVTLISYMAAARDMTGGVYYVFWGAVLWGAIEIIRGVYGCYHYDSDGRASSATGARVTIQCTGQKCFTCSQMITIEIMATACPSCTSVYHKRCLTGTTCRQCRQPNLSY